MFSKNEFGAFACSITDNLSSKHLLSAGRVCVTGYYCCGIWNRLIPSVDRQVRGLVISNCAHIYLVTGSARFVTSSDSTNGADRFDAA